MKAKVLIVDDEEVILETLSYRLTREGFEVLTASDGSSATEKVLQEDPDLVILDIMLPEVDGYEVCRILRTRGYLKPVILVSARDEEMDKVIGLEVGADDYLTKPFSTRELIARVRAHLRREKRREAPAGMASGKPPAVPPGRLVPATQDNPAEAAQMAFDSLVIVPESHKVFLDGEEVSLSPKEYDLLLFLASNPGRVLTQDHLLERVWGYDFEGDSNIVQVTVRRLRQKLKEETRREKFIATLRGVGYRFEGKRSQ